MSYHGKTYQKVKFDNMIELLEKLNVGEKTLNLIKRSETVSAYEKNPDGSIQYTIKKGDAVVMTQKFEHNKEAKFPSPDGQIIKSISTIDGDALKSVLTMPDGKIIHLDRYFDGDKMRMEVQAEGIDIKGIVYYEAI